MIILGKLEPTLESIIYHERASKTLLILTYLAGSLGPVSFKAPYLSDAEFKINMILVVWILAKRSDF